MSAYEQLNPQLFSTSRFERGTEQDRRISRQARELTTFGEVRVSASLDAAEQILEDGDIRTQHETGSSEGLYDPRKRSRLEDEMGFQTNPVYGFLARSPSEKGFYGPVDVHLKSSVKDRATFLEDDTLDLALEIGRTPQVMPVDKVRDGSAKVRAEHLHGAEDDEDIDFTSYPYTEVQIPADRRPETHGEPQEGNVRPARVPLSDVHRMTLSPYSRSQRYLDLGARAESRGVPVDYRVEDRVEQPELGLVDHQGAPIPTARTVSSTRTRLVRHKDLGPGEVPWRNE